MKAAFYTLGCKVNQYESEYMAELLRSAGFEIVSPDQEADYYIVNSCTVTATADQKTRQSVRRFKRRHPGATVILTGCMPQAFPEEAKAQLIERNLRLVVYIARRFENVSTGCLLYTSPSPRDS